MTSAALYSASSPSHESRQPWHCRCRVADVFSLVLSTVKMQAVNVSSATITSHGCEAQNSPCARNNRQIMFSINLFLFRHFSLFIYLFIYLSSSALFALLQTDCNLSEIKIKRKIKFYCILRCARKRKL